MSCLTENEALAYLDGLLGAAALAASEEHIDDCTTCAELLAHLTRLASPTAPAAAAQSRAPDEDLVLPHGAIVGRYVVIDVIGVGGMAVVYAAFDPKLDRKVALKLIRSDVMDIRTPAAAAHLLAEAQAVAKLSHPNVVSVFDLGSIDDQVFMAMEFVDGRTLGRWLREEPRGWRQILEAFLNAGAGLAAAHEVGLVHRDFKPDNVLVGADERVRVTDFGLARRVADPLAPEQIVGTPAYMAPEQRAGQALDARADQYAFCVALWEALFGQRPPGATRDAQVPGWVRRALARGLAHDPAARFPSMRVLLGQLGRASAVARRRLGIGLGAAAATCLVVSLSTYRHFQAPTCTGGKQRLAGVWDAARKAKLKAVLAASSMPHAADGWPGVERILDGYAASWVAMERDSCEATRVRGAQSPELYDLRMACLQERRGELAQLGRVLEQGDQEVTEKAVSAAAALTPLATCANTQALLAVPPPPAERRAAIDAVSARVAEAKALRDTGKYQEGLTVAMAAAGDARKLGYAPLVTRALFLLGDLQRAAGDTRSATQSLWDAVDASNPARTRKPSPLGDEYEWVSVMGTSSPKGTSVGAITSSSSRDTCLHTAVGQCVVDNCPAGPVVPSPSVDGGRITITGGAQPIVLTYNPATTAYNRFKIETPFWQGGERLTIRGEGNPGLRPFVTDVIAPHPVTLTAPVLPVTGALTIDSTTDFTVHWSGGGEGYATVSLIHMAADGASLSAECYFDPRAHHGAVPAAILSLFPRGAPAEGEFNTFEFGANAEQTGKRFASGLHGFVVSRQFFTKNGTLDDVTVVFK